ncbi:MAG TPA: sulfate ABC transporter permease subunit CysT [Solirubrobacterales bacterium]|jgi:sulfate transport system permease protein|nr:sulfate ABC transporter permease subunit CysT [Solirubrobacterales bacterium]
MEAHPANLPAPTSSRAGLRLPGIGTGVGNGMVVLYLSIIVLLPLAAVASEAFSLGIGHFWEQVTSPLAKKSLELTVVCSLIVVVLNAFFGTILAWLLVRDEFPGKSIINAVIDLPFALPTIVASLVLLTLYGTDSPLGIDIASTRAAVVVALMFVTLPFVVRAVQPLLLEMDREMEAAAASLGAGNFTIFRRIIFPNLLPGLGAGIALAFARALGEFGSVLLFAGGLPDTTVTSVFIRNQVESNNLVGASAVSMVLLFASLLLLFCVSLIQRWAIRHDRSSSEFIPTLAKDVAGGGHG